MTSDELTGRTLGDFVVRHRIGEGGFGAVYRAEQPLLGREAVIKVLHGRHRSSPTVIQRFLREARLASKLDHPYAAHIYAFGAESDHLMWIAMEYVRGQTLFDLLRTGPMPLDTFVPLLDRICEVLQAAHDLGIVHRDIKPANVMVIHRSGRVFPKLLDFGIAKLAEDPPRPLLLEPAQPTSSPAPSDASTPTPAAPSSAGGDKTIDFVGPVGGAIGNVLARAKRPSVGFAQTVDAPIGDSDPSLTPDNGVGPALTQAGAAVGSPPYMAPEQWDDSAAATARTDLYALGVLAFEALTGHRPFHGTTVSALAIAHAMEPVPPLGGTLPPGIDAVMQKVLAKLPEDRYASALEFAQEFRAASGFGGQPLPALADELRQQVEISFPQPIAEAVAAFHAARNAHQGRDAMRDVVTVAIRYVAMLALAAQAQVRIGDATPNTAVADLLRDLRRRALTDEEWLALARELTAPFRSRAQAHPMPELVALLALEGEADPLAEAVQPRPATADPMVTIRELLPAITRLLRGLAFVSDYPLVVAVEGRAESWMGVRRPRRVAFEVQGRAIEAGQPVVLDANSRPVLVLWPIVQIAAPMPGSAPELFLLDGRGRRGARLVALPQPLERQHDGVWDWFGKSFNDQATEAQVQSSDEKLRPYRGLESFTSSDAEAFFGREREVDAAINRLRTSSLVAVVGPSGAGKSSFVHAGVLPSLPEGWTTISMRPGASPIATLEGRLKRAGFVVTDLWSALTLDASAVGALLATRDTPTVLVIDQFEELFTLGASAGERRTFVRGLLGALGDHVRVVLTLRDDFLNRATQIAELRDVLPTSLFLLGTPMREELIGILVQPLARVGYDFEDRDLPAKMVDDVAETPSALALLSFAASKLWELRDRRFRVLTRKGYDALGGVAGALARHAEATLAELSAHEQRLARTALGHLVTADGTRVAMSRTELDEILRDPQGSRVIEKLIASRLLTASESESGADMIEIIHEALLVAWPRLSEWRLEDAAGSRLRDQLRAAARQWLDRNKPRGLLWRDDALAELRVWRHRHPQALTGTEDAFVAASLADARKGRRLRVGIIAVVLGLMAIAVAVSLYARESTRSAAAREHDRYFDEVVERARKAVLDGRAADARQAISDARQLGATQSPSFDLMAAAASLSERALVAALPGHKGAIFAVALDGTNGRLVTAGDDGVAKVWDLATRQMLATPTDCRGRLYGVKFDPQRQRFVADCSDGTFRVYDARGTLVRSFPAGGGTGENFFTSQFTPDGTKLLTIGGIAITLWEVTSGRRMWTATADNAQESLAISADGKIAASTEIEGGGRIVVWSLADGSRLRSFSTGYTTAIELDRSGQFLVAANADRTARIWDVAKGTVVREFLGHANWVDFARYSPDGSLIATASRDLTVRLWRVATGELLISFPTGRGYATGLEFDERGHLAVGTTDGMAIVWDVASAVQLASFEASRGVAIRTIAFDAKSQRLVTAGDDGIARVWNATPPIIRHVLHHGSKLLGVHVAGDHGIYTIGGDGTVKHWDLATGSSTSTTSEGLLEHTQSVALRDGSLAWGDSTGAVYRWDGVGARKQIAHHGAAITAIGSSADGRSIASGDAAGGVQIISGSGAPVSLAGHASNILAIAFTDDDQTLATGDGRGNIVTWRRDGGRIATLTGHADMIRALGFTRDNRLMSVSGDSTVRLWSPAGERLRTFTGHGGLVVSLAIARDQRHAVTTSTDSTARVWDLETGQQTATMQHNSLVMQSLFSDDDAFVVTVGTLPIVRVWDAVTGRELLELDGHTDFVWSVVAGPGPHQFTTCSFDGNAIVWELPH